MGLESDEVGSIILIGGRRRWRQRLGDPEYRSYFWERASEIHRFVYGTPFPAWYTTEAWLEGVDFGYEDYAEIFRRPDHKPIMLVDGEREHPRDKQYFEDLYARLEGVKRFTRLAGSNHYANTAQTLGLIVYDRAVMQQLVDEIDAWLATLR